MTSQESELEIDNLRPLVHDVQDELCFLHKIKAENTKLKAELSSDLSKKMSEAQDEINYLNSQLQIYKDYKFKVYTVIFKLIFKIYMNLQFYESNMHR